MAAKTTKTAPSDKASPSRAAATASPARPTLCFSRTNAIWLGAGVVSIAIGYVLLSTGSEKIAPILLVLGYCVLLPIGIIKK